MSRKEDRDRRNQELLRLKAQEYILHCDRAKAEYEAAADTLNFIIGHAAIGQVWELDDGRKVQLINNAANGNAWYHASRSCLLDIKPVKKGK